MLWQQLGAPGDPPYSLILRFERHTWPGNVRELANAVARFVSMGDAGVKAKVGVSGGDSIEEILSRDLPFPRARDCILAEFERRYVQRVLAAHGGSVARAAEASGIGRRYLSTLLSRSGK
jgi:DNA-binding NtrC family response regulator